MLLLNRLDNPHLKLPPVFHVAGTNGKGSTLAFLQAIFEAGGKTVHKFTSPHLVRFEERIVVGGRMISPELLLGLIDECDRAARGDRISFFEFFTALAFLAFSRLSADAVLLETGLGGTEDATNVIPFCEAAILTRISYDHMRLLGEGLVDIAQHKAGIIKPRCPVVIAPQPDSDVVALFLRTAVAQGAPVSLARRDWRAQATENSFDYSGRAFSGSLPLPSLSGEHQIVNAATAIAALENSRFSDLLDQKILARGLQMARWPGRLQRLTSGTLSALLPKGAEIWVDGAHNDSGAEVLARQIGVWGPEKPLHIITAFKKKKDAEGFYRPLSGLAKSVHAVGFPIDAPMLLPEELCEALRRTGFANVNSAENIEDAIRAAAFSSDPPGRILITGSLYLAGHALKINGDIPA